MDTDIEFCQNLEDSIRKRGDLLRKIKDEGRNHLAEKLKLQVSMDDR